MRLKFSLFISVLLQCLVVGVAVFVSSQPDPDAAGGVVIVFASVVYGVLAVLTILPIALWSVCMPRSLSERRRLLALIALPLILFFVGIIFARFEVLNLTKLALAGAVLPGLIMFFQVYFANRTLKKQLDISCSTRMVTVASLLVMTIIPTILMGMTCYICLGKSIKWL